MSNIPIIIAIVTVVLTVGTQIFINTKLKFAKTEEEAMSHTKNLALNLGFIIIICIIVYRLFSELTSPSPLDRKSLASILFWSFSLFNFYFMWIIWPILKILRDFLSLHAKSVSVQEQSLDLHRKTLNALNKDNSAPDK